MARHLPETSDRKLWQLPVLDPAKRYSAYRASPRVVEVLEQGSRALHRERVDPAAPGDYRVEGRWLVHRTYPRAAEASRRQQVEDDKRAEARAKELAAAEAKPAFVAFIRRLTRELGRARRVKACDQWFRAFAAPDAARCAELVREARASSAAATVFVAPRTRELRVVAGRIGRLSALFDWPCYASGDLEPALDALDRDAGLTLDHVADVEQFAMHLERVPRRLATHAAALADCLALSERWVASALRRRALAVDAPAATT